VNVRLTTTQKFESNSGEADVAGFPVFFMYFSRRLVPALCHVIFSSVHIMANVGKRCSCVCDSLEVTTDKTDKDADD